MVIHTEEAHARISVPDVAKWLGVHSCTVRRWVAEGRMPKPFVLGKGGRPRFDVAEIRAWIAANTGGPTAVTTETPTK